MKTLITSALIFVAAALSAQTDIDKTIPVTKGQTLRLWFDYPELVKISNEYESRGLVVLGLATSYNEHNDQQHVKDYVKTQNVPYKIIWDDGTLAAPLVQMVQAQSVIPQSFVISRDGRILKHFQGFNPYSTPQLMRQAVEEALNEKGKA